jgi:hypothetical protein
MQYTSYTDYLQKRTACGMNIKGFLEPVMRAVWTNNKEEK